MKLKVMKMQRHGGLNPPMRGVTQLYPTTRPPEIRRSPLAVQNLAALTAHTRSMSRLTSPVANQSTAMTMVDDFSDYFYGNVSQGAPGRNESLLPIELLKFSNCSTNMTMNATCLTGQPEEEIVREYNYWALLLLIFPVFTLFGNVLVIMSVMRERALQTVTNYFIVSLAVADLMVACVVMPFGVYYLVHGSWGLPAFMCDIYIAMDVTSSTSSIFNLVAISIDRYIAVTQPIKYAKHKNNRRAWFTIVLVWVISATIGAPIVLGLNDTPDRNYNECLFNSQNYVIYSSLGSFYIPCIMMMFLYYSIFKALRERVKKQKLAKRPPQPGESASGATTAVVIENVAQTRRFAETSLHEDRPTNTGSGSNEDERDDSYDKRSADLEADADECHVIPNDKSTEFMLATVIEEGSAAPKTLKSRARASDANGNNDSGYVPSNIEDAVREQITPPASPGMKDATVLQNLGCKELKSSLRKNGQKSRNASVTLLTEAATSRFNFRSQNKKERKASSTARFTIYKANKASKKKREKSSARKERKATKTLAIVLGVFLVCWTPFFTCNVLDAICVKSEANCSPGVTVFILTTWLGYINSFLNPVIYTIFNPEFRKAFRKILKCGA